MHADYTECITRRFMGEFNTLLSIVFSVYFSRTKIVTTFVLSAWTVAFCVTIIYFFAGVDTFVFVKTVPPMIWIQNQLVGAQEGELVTLECMSEAYPNSIDYWTKDKTTIISNG